MKNNSTATGLTICSNISNNDSSCSIKPKSITAGSFLIEGPKYYSTTTSSKANNNSINRSESIIGKPNSSLLNCSDQLSSVVESFSSSKDDVINIRIDRGFNFGIGVADPSTAYGLNIPTSSLTSTAFGQSRVLDTTNNSASSFLRTSRYKTYPAINSAYWLPSLNPSPYTVPEKYWYNSLS
ncbi:uncharacterized protein [Eurosta solidaginis]|uniref:uncharacterized protein n=1 Tax=Eurosta solidaginis TaxID=178769 RepID=UPI0035313DA5